MYLGNSHEMDASPAKFITLEGVEGCGKTLQCDFLKKEFHKFGLPCLFTHQPGGTPLGLELRKVLLKKDGAQREAISELLLYLADRYQDLKERIEPALDSDIHVVCDRYHDATLAYQGYARGIGLTTVDRLAQVLEFRKPDLTVVLDLDVEVGLKRAHKRIADRKQDEWSRFEREELHFHNRVREGYLQLQSREPDRIKVVDASKTPEEVFAGIRRLLQEIGLLSSPD